MKIIGIEGLTNEQVDQEIARGGKFVMFTWVVSVLIMTFKRPSDVYFIRAGESSLGKALPFILISLVAGWWGFPFGLIYTPISIVQNLSGGKDVTSSLVSAARAPAAAARPAGPSTGAPLNPR